MNDDERKPRFHIHLAGLIILIIIGLIIFKVDIKSKIESPQFQKNITYIEDTAKGFWEKYILTPIKSKTGDIFIDITDKGVKQIQDSFTNNILKTPNTENTTN